MKKATTLFLSLIYFVIFSQNNAQFISQTTVPTTLDPGEQFTVSITMKNTGTSTWTVSDSYNLGSQNPQDNTDWLISGRISLTNDVAPGEEYTFTQTFTAPTINGIYNFQWRMVQDGVEWFGDYTQNVEILVSNYSLVGTTIPTGDKCYQLTGDSADCGAVWYKDKIDLRNPFDINFTLNMQNLKNHGADGMMFVLQNESDTALGNAGGSLGYNGIGTRSMGVEFDVYNNRQSCGLGNWPDDPPYDYWNGPEPADCSDHIAISRNGNVLCEIAQPVSMFEDPTQSIEDDTVPHQVRIKWNPNTDSIHVYLDCILRIAVKYNIIDSIFQGEYLVYWGFTGSTGPWDYDKIEVCLDGNIFSALEDRTICKGNSIELNVQGATYGNPTWSPNYNIDDIHSDHPVVNPLVDTTYYLSYTHPKCGDSRIDSVRISVNEPTATISGGGDICDDGSTTDIIIDFTGGPDFTYQWTLNGNALPQGTASTHHITIPQSTPGTYLLTGVTDSLGCPGIVNGSASITLNPLPTPHINGNLYFCDGQNTTLDAGTYNSYIWNTGANTQTITIDTAGQYIVTVTDNNSCSNSDTVTVSVNPLPNINITVTPGTEICFGDTITLDASSSTGFGNLQFVWSTYADTSIINITPSNDSTYYLTLTDDNSCENIDTINIIVNELPYFTSADIVDVTNCITHNGEITLNAGGGTPPYNFNINGSAFSNVNHWDTLNSVVYTYGVVDSKGCEYYQNYAIPNSSGLAIDTVLYNQLMCYGDTTHIIIIPAVNGNIYYSISSPINYFTDSIFYGVPAGNYNINIIDSTTNCEAGYALTITQPDELQLTAISKNTICDTANGMLTVIVNGGTPSYSYTWSEFSINNDTLQNIPAGNYTLTVTDANSCSDSVNFVVEDHSTGTIQIDSIINVACNNDSSGVIYASITGGNPNFNYYWYADTNLISSVSNAANTNFLHNIPAGYYTLQIIDNMNCETSIDSIYISQPEALNLTYNISPVMCHNDYSGSITTNISGGVQPYEYLWSTSDTTNNLDSLNGGTFILTVTDHNNCKVYTDSIKLTNPDELVLNVLSHTDLTCFESADGELSFEYYGGTPGYVVKLNNDQEVNQNVTNLDAGTYIISITDNNQCNVSDTVIISQPEMLILQDTVYYEKFLGNITVNAIGGTPDYNYIWNNGETSNSNLNLETGTYYVTVTDKNNCQAVYSYDIDTEVMIPTVITPNGDGNNDTWKIIGFKNYEKITISIFNRWGDKVFGFEGSGLDYYNSSVQWNGQYSGKELPLGTYVYIIKVEGGKDYSGTITIIR